MKNFTQTAAVVSLPAPYDVLSGGGALVGKLFGVAVTDGQAGDDVAFNVTGAFDLPKTSAQAWTIGALVYWDDTAKAVTTTASTNVQIGHALAVAANPSAVGRVRLSA
jgi:predicted RecA/RadA family phage recombinase